MVAELQGLLEPAIPKGRRAHREIYTLLEHAVVQQAESSLCWRCKLDASQRVASGQHVRDVSVHQAPCASGGHAWPRCMSVLASTMTHVTPWMPVGMDEAMRERKPAATTIVVATDATIVVRTGARAPTGRDLRPSANTSSTPPSDRVTDRRPTS